MHSFSETRSCVAYINIFLSRSLQTLKLCLCEGIRVDDAVLPYLITIRTSQFLGKSEFDRNDSGGVGTIARSIVISIGFLYEHTIGHLSTRFYVYLNFLYPLSCLRTSYSTPAGAACRKSLSKYLVSNIYKCTRT